MEQQEKLPDFIKYLEQGIKDKHVEISDDEKRITYTYQNKSRNLTNPEEKVQADIFLRLIYDYGYLPEQIEQFKSVTTGAETREADIIVYEDKTRTKPKIVIECKKQEVSEGEYRQAINQAFSYAHAMAGTIKYIWVTSGILNEFYLFDKESETKESLTDIPRYGEDKVAPYKYVKGGGMREYIDYKTGEKKIQKFEDIKTVSEVELTRIFKQAHDALWAGGQLNPSEAFDELDKLIFCKIWDEKYKLDGDKKEERAEDSGDIYLFQVITTELTKEDRDLKLPPDYRTNKELAERVKFIYSKGKAFDKEVFKDDIRLSDARIRTVVTYLQGINLSETDLDSKGRAFEAFMGSFFRGDFGQYFTPRPIVDFIVKTLNIENTSRVLDTSCGSGGFLLHALDKVRQQADSKYNKNTPKGYNSWFNHWHKFAESNLFGIEINEQIARTAKMNMIIHDDGHTNVIASDGLIDLSTMRATSHNNEFKENSMDFVITNPPFGSTVRKSEKGYLKNFTLGRKTEDWLSIKVKKTEDNTRDTQSTEILFIERCYHFLKENGFLAIVIPDGVLTNGTAQYVRDQVEEWFRVVAVVSMPQTAFAANGAGVKSSVLFLRKWENKVSEKYTKLKIDAQISAKSQFNYESEYKWLEKEKAEVIKKHIGFINRTGLDIIKEIEKTEDFIIWKKEIQDEYNQKITDLKEAVTEAYKIELKAKLKEKNLNYPIFMAIAENIGYDATGKPTDINELEEIGEHLKDFIKNIEGKK